MSLRWDTGLKWDTADFVALEFLWSSHVFLLGFVAHIKLVGHGSTGLLKARFLLTFLVCVTGRHHLSTVTAIPVRTVTTNGGNVR